MDCAHCVCDEGRTPRSIETGANPGARAPLNRCCAFAPDLESMLRDKIIDEAFPRTSARVRSACTERRSDSIVTNFFFTEPAWRLLQHNLPIGDSRRQLW